MFLAVVQGWWPPVSFSLNVVGEIMMKGAENEMTHPVSIIRCFIMNRRIKLPLFFLLGESYMSHRTVPLYESVTSGVSYAHQQRHGMACRQITSSTASEITEKKIDWSIDWLIKPSNDASLHRGVSSKKKWALYSTLRIFQTTIKFLRFQWRVLVFLCCYPLSQQ